MCSQARSHELTRKSVRGAGSSAVMLLLSAMGGCQVILYSTLIPLDLSRSSCEPCLVLSTALLIRRLCSCNRNHVFGGQ